MLHAGQQYQLGLSCHHPIDGYHPSPLPSALPAPGIDLVWRWENSVTHNSPDHTLCLMLIVLARSKKVSANVELCFWGGDCRGKMFEIVFSCKMLLRFFPFYPYTFCHLRPSCRFNRGKRFAILVIVEINLHDWNKGKNRDLQICCYSNSCRYSRCR